MVTIPAHFLDTFRFNHTYLPTGRLEMTTHKLIVFEKECQFEWRGTSCIENELIKKSLF